MEQYQRQSCHRDRGKEKWQALISLPALFGWLQRNERGALQGFISLSTLSLSLRAATAFRLTLRESGSHNSLKVQGTVMPTPEAVFKMRNGCTIREREREKKCERERE